MSLADLLKDCQRNGKMENILAAGVPPEIAAYFEGTVWPVLEALVEEASEMDETMQDLIEEADDVLHPPTAMVFAGVIELGSRLANRVKQLAPGDATAMEEVKAFQIIADNAKTILEEITIPVEEANDEDDDEGDEGDEKEKV